MRPKPLGPHGRFNRFRARLGIRGFILIFFGAAWILIGAAVTAEPPMPIRTLPHTLLPIWARFVLWAGFGSVALICGVISYWRRLALIVGFFFLVWPPAERAVSFTYAAVAESNSDLTLRRYVIPLPAIEGVEWPRVIAATLYWVITVAILLLGSWPEEQTIPPELAAHAEEDRDHER